VLLVDLQTVLGFHCALMMHLFKLYNKTQWGKDNLEHHCDFDIGQNCYSLIK